MKKEIRDALAQNACNDVTNQLYTPKEGEIGALARAVLFKDLKRPPKRIRERLQLCRAGLEADGLIGARAGDIHLHQHNSLPPVVQQMLESKMREMMMVPPLKLVGKGTIVDPQIAVQDEESNGTVLPERAESSNQDRDLSFSGTGLHNLLYRLP
jgi:hypothetical protein